MKRREFVIQTIKGVPLALAAPTLLTSCGSDEEETVTPNPPGGNDDDDDGGSDNNNVQADVIVIGAGMAGLAAARELQAEGLNVKVLESQEKVGGRVRTNREIGVPFDEGASWIHGPDGGNPITQLGREAGASTYRTANRTETIYTPDGELISESEVASLVGQYQQVMTEVQANAGVNDSVEDVLQRLYPEVLQDPIGLYLISALLEFDTGTDISRLSARHFNDADAFPGDDVLFPNGYDAIPNYLAQGLDITLNTRVTAVDYSGERTIVTTNDQIYEAPYVVVTVPLGVLKNDVIQFTPALPSQKQQAINGIEMGMLNKFLFTWGETFWTNEAQHIGCAVEEKGRFIYFLNANTFAPSANALMGFAFGNYGLETESMSDGQVVDAAMDSLRRIYGSGIPQPSNMLRTSWSSNPHSYGCYSFFTKGYESSVLEVLGQEVDSKLFFAGEHTTSLYNATVHGAYLTGIREADKIKQLVNG